MLFKKVVCSITMCGGTDMTCCFIGHRKMEQVEEIEKLVQDTIYSLLWQGVNHFIFGDHSDFNSLCYEIVTELKDEFPHIRRTHYRTDYPDADDYTMQFLLDGYEDSICPVGVAGAGRAAYVKRNQAMINDSDICVFYFSEEYKPALCRESKRAITSYQPKSGTKLAFDYAKALGKRIINLYQRKNYGS